MSDNDQDTGEGCGQGCGGCLVLFLIIGACGNIFGWGEEEKTAPTTATQVEEVSELENAAPITGTIERLEYEYDNLSETLKYEIEDDNITVIVIFSENLTQDMTKRGFKYSVEKILRATKASGMQFNKLIINGYYGIDNRFGETEDRLMVFLAYRKETVDRINWSRFLTENVYSIADEREISPIAL